MMGVNAAVRSTATPDDFGFLSEKQRKGIHEDALAEVEKIHAATPLSPREIVERYLEIFNDKRPETEAQIADKVVESQRVLIKQPVAGAMLGAMAVVGPAGIDKLLSGGNPTPSREK